MLVKFRVKNFKSFKEMNEFSMIKGKQRFYEERVADLDDAKVLKFSAIFGANASGKSNIIRAIKVMQYIVLNNMVPNDAADEYYKLDSACASLPTYFEMIFTIKNIFYSYGFELYLGNKKIESEWLYILHRKSDGTIDEKMIFEKKDKDIFFKSKNISERISIYKEDIKLIPTKLFLTHVASNRFAFADKNDEIAQNIINVFDWFQSSLRVLYTGEALYTPSLTSKINEDKIGDLLNYFDTGIKRISLKQCDEYEFRKDVGVLGIDLNSLQNSLEMKNKNRMNEKESIIIRTISDIWIVELDNDKHKLKYNRLCFYHDKEKTVPFRVFNESDGTLRLFELAEAIISDKLDRVIIVDELDRCLHPILTIKYIKLFLNKALGKNDNSQLIVTTHESRLMDLDILRRDEIWFTKKENGESKLYSLEEFNVRFDKIIDKAYLDGRYGGIPIFDSVFFPEYIKHES